MASAADPSLSLALVKWINTFPLKRDEPVATLKDCIRATGNNFILREGNLKKLMRELSAHYENVVGCDPKTVESLLGNIDVRTLAKSGGDAELHILCEMILGLMFHSEKKDAILQGIMTLDKSAKDHLMRLTQSVMQRFTPLATPSSAPATPSAGTPSHAQTPGERKEREKAHATPVSSSDLKAVSHTPKVRLQDVQLAADSEMRKLEAVQGENHRLKDEVQQVNQEIQTLRDECAALRFERTDLEQQLQAALDEKVSSGTNAEKSAADTKQMAELEQKISDLSIDLRVSKEDLQKARTRLADSEAQEGRFRLLQDENDALQARLEEMERLETKVRALERKCQAGEDATRQLRSAEERLQQQRLRIDDLEGQLTQVPALQGQIDQLRRQVTSAKSAESDSRVRLQAAEDARERVEGEMRALREEGERMQRMMKEREREIEAAQNRESSSTASLGALIGGEREKEREMEKERDESVERERDSLRKELEEVKEKGRKSAVEMQEKILSLETDLEIERGSVSDLRSQLSSLESQLTDVQAQLQQQAQAHQQEKSELMEKASSTPTVPPAALEEARQQLAAAEQRVSEATMEATVAKKQCARLRKANELLEEQVKDMERSNDEQSTTEAHEVQTLRRLNTDLETQITSLQDRCKQAEKAVQMAKDKERDADASHRLERKVVLSAFYGMGLELVRSTRPKNIIHAPATPTAISKMRKRVA